jgi:hypothetical protein
MASRAEREGFQGDLVPEPLEHWRTNSGYGPRQLCDVAVASVAARAA